LGCADFPRQKAFFGKLQPVSREKKAFGIDLPTVRPKKSI
jgi:hypothetical protein